MNQFLQQSGWKKPSIRWSIWITVVLIGIHQSLRAAVLPTIPSTLFNITTYGAISSTTVDNTSAIQQTINACSAAGGGVVVIPAGTFLSGPISMKSKINLQISAGATLRLLPYGSGNGTVTGTYPNSGTTDDYTDFIYGKNLTNIAITGTGTIEGDGSAWWTAYDANSAISRPCVVRFDGCKYILISGITIQNAPNVHITIGKSGSDATLKDLTITAPSDSPNTDGIDTWAPNIDIYNCNIAVGDDNIAMDSGSQNITIKKCTFGVGHGCSVGSYASGVGTITVDSCSFSKTTSGIRLKTARGRGGVEQYFTYSNITMSGVTNPFYITSYYPKEPTTPGTDAAQTVSATTPAWQHITFKNITVTGSTNAGIIWGLPEQSIVDVVFDNVTNSAKTGMKAYYVSGLVFKNGSSVSVSSGSALTTYSTTFSGINASNGQAISTATGIVVKPELICYPNPVTGGKIHLKAPSVIGGVKLISLNGSVLKAFCGGTESMEIDIQGLSSGAYLLEVEMNQQAKQYIKVIK